MRRIVRTVAAGFVVILGLALVSAASFSSDIVRATLPDAPTAASEKGDIAPLSPPKPGKGQVRNIGLDAAAIFATEFGQRGKHQVTVSMGGQGYYQVYWRQGKAENGLGNYNRTRTVEGGFPLALIVVNGLGRSASCSITIDGIEKDAQATSAKEPIVFCEG